MQKLTEWDFDSIKVGDVLYGQVQPGLAWTVIHTEMQVITIGRGDHDLKPSRKQLNRMDIERWSRA